MGADGFIVRQGHRYGFQIAGGLVQKENVLAVAVNERLRAGGVQPPRSRGLGGGSEALPFLHLCTLKEGNGNGQKEKEDAENGNDDGKTSADDGLGHDAVKPQRSFRHLKAFRQVLLQVCHILLEVPL